MMRTVLGVTIFGVLLSMAAVCQAGDDSKALAITQGQPGLKVGENLYPVGMNAADFRKQYGEPDLSDSQVMDYLGAGIRVMLNKEGTIRGFAVYLVPTNVHERYFKAANVVTDAGIGAGATYTQVIQTYGEPIDMTKFGGVRSLIYPFGIIRLTGNSATAMLIGNPFATP